MSYAANNTVHLVTTNSGIIKVKYSSNNIMGRNIIFLKNILSFLMVITKLSNNGGRNEIITNAR
jgi:hypothetical protein